MPLMNNKAYAEHRHVTPAMISKLKKRGYFKDALVFKKGRKIPLIDSELADRILEKNLDPNYTKGNKRNKQDRNSKSKDQTFVEARTKAEHYKALDRQMKFELQSKTLVNRQDVENAVFKAGRICRDSLLNIGPRLAAQLVVINDENEILKLFNAEVSEVLRELINELGNATNV